MSRFVVTELEGSAKLGTGATGNATTGLSCHIIDTAVNHRLIATYRTEDVGGGVTHSRRRASVREAAWKHAARLNAEVA